jgi:non-heme chloroperoxidase
MAGVIKDVIYDAGAKNTIPVTKEVLDWSLQMAMQAGIRGLLACVDAFGRTDFRSELRAVNVPTLILHGTNDKPVPFGITARVAAAGIAKAKLIEYKGASHGVLVTERDRVTRDLLEFLNS